ncbi:MULTISPECIES: integrase core domain-containing protein [unclassified Pseudofrankia]|uniref:integrase core domain-containing protein n=1 Tax=unclassified Pseudofrankia TaxID=2994372 RepID=UPI000A6B0A29|nr:MULTISPECIES: integrase core domain-containing protein [unclassified Pseudofrankia]MDT3439322.1 integrase core domain-containing protein [Pseudofrankia sp. BMG5.37]
MHPTPRASAYAERWVRTVRAECLDWILIWNRRHAEQVLSIYVEHYNTARTPPRPRPRHPRPDDLVRRSEWPDQTHRLRRIDRLGGLLHECQHAA